MKMLFDLYCTQPSKSVFHGGGIYGQILFEVLINHDSVVSGDVQVSVLIHPEKYLPERIRNIIKQRSLKIESCSSRDDVINILWSRQHDLFYSPMPNYLMDKLKAPPPLKIVVTLHDLRDLDIKYDWYYRQYQPNRIKRLRLFIINLFHRWRLNNLRRKYSQFITVLGGRLITDSQHSKYRLLTEFPELNFDDVSVFYPLDKISESPPIEEVENILKKYGVAQKEYFLLLACNRPGKNALRVIAAIENYRLLSSSGKMLLCIGFTPKQINHVIKLYPGSSDYSRFIPYVKEEELQALYKGSFCLLFPSISEGYGYPPIEAMRNEIPVIASSVTSIPEVCQNAVLYANPYHLGEIANRINMILKNQTLRKKLIEKGKKRVREIDIIHNSERKEFVNRIIR